MSNEEILKALDNVINDNKNTEVLTGNLNVYNMASSCKFKILDLIEENKKLNNIINELEDSIVGKINVLYQVRGQSNAIQELSILLRQLRELKGNDKK